MTPPRTDPSRQPPPCAPAGKALADNIRLQDEPGHLIRRAHQLAVSVFHDAHGRQITPVQYVILRALRDTPGIDQVTLADKVALDTSTTADIATRLENKGWIVRQLLARRQRALSLTPEGEAVIKGILPAVATMNQQLLQSLEPSEQAQFLRLLRKFVGLDAAGSGSENQG